MTCAIKPLGIETAILTDTDVTFMHMKETNF